MRLSQPVLSVRIRPTSASDERRLAAGLSTLANADHTIRVKTDSETGELLVLGMSESHLQLIRERLKTEYGVKSDFGSPRAAYQETVRKGVVQEGEFVRQIEDQRQYGRCVLRIEPLAAGTGVEFKAAAKNLQATAREFAAVEKGVIEGLEGGVLIGGPIVDVRVTLEDASFGDPHSNEMSLRIAAAMAARSGSKKANPTILEPIMEFEFAAPEPSKGEILSDLKAHRATIESIEERGSAVRVRGTIPVSETIGYASLARANSWQEGSFSLEPKGFEEVPLSIYRKLLDLPDSDEPPAASAR